jgi:UDP-N-acetylglucosamine--N-acetylmuramyl-(pentapeptide) pyrophosphoryl-undecaprenol N-acetylglucosamine transferase
VTVVFAGGGTGGHIYPAIAIADALRQRAAKISFIGTADRLEARIVPQAGYDLHTIAAHALPRRFSLELFRTFAANVAGTVQSFKLLGRERPDLVVATGGYVSFPVALAARILRMTHRSPAIVLLEPNAEPGLTNRLLAPIVDEVWGAQTTGVPIRASLAHLPSREAAAARLGLSPALQTLVVMGGSQGARRINDSVIDLVRTGGLPDGWQLLHLTGEGEFQRAREAARAIAGSQYVALPYLDDMAGAYAVADLLIARAGASTLAELGALGKPAILVPYPHAAGGHQASNAARLEAGGAAVVVTDRQLRDGALSALLAQTVEPARLEAMTQAAQASRSGDAVAAILARIDRLVSRNSER